METGMILRTIYHTTRADFLERVRRYRTLVTLGLAVFFTYVILPDSTATYLTFNIGHVRGVYNSAWVGAVVTVFCVFIFCVPALLLVQGTIDQDRHTGVGQIIATTPLRKVHYTVGKMLSNFAYLAALTGATFLIAIGMQLLRGEVLRITLWDYVGPYLLIVLPLMALVAAFAVLGDAVAWLGNGRGRQAVVIVWGLIWASLGGVLAEGMPYLYNGGPPPAEAPVSFTGVPAVFYSMYAAAREQSTGEHYGLFIATLPNGTNVNIAQAAARYPEYDDPETAFELRTFVWDGIRWTWKTVLGGLLWFPVAVVIAALAALPFDRFDPAKQPEQQPRRKTRRVETSLPPDVTTDNAVPAVTSVRLTPLPAARARHGVRIFIRVVYVELKLMFKGIRWWWFAGMAGLIVAGMFGSLDYVRQFAWPLAWVWPIFIWPSMGSRETFHNTRGMVLSSPFPMRRQLLACWVAGFIVTVISGSSVLVRLILAAEWSTLLAWCAAALFIPSLALALGTWTGARKAFEGIYLILWYLGPWNKLYFLDFMSTTDQALASGIPLIILITALLLLVGAVVWRRRQQRV